MTAVGARPAAVTPAIQRLVEEFRASTLDRPQEAIVERPEVAFRRALARIHGSRENIFRGQTELRTG